MFRSVIFSKICPYFRPCFRYFRKYENTSPHLPYFWKKYWIYSSLYKRRNMAPGGVYEVLIYVLNLRQIERWKRSLSLSQLCSTVTLLMAATECQTLNIELAVGITEHHLKLQTQKWKSTISETIIFADFPTWTLFSIKDKSKIQQHHLNDEPPPLS